jgi:hypothetical protein
MSYPEQTQPRPVKMVSAEGDLPVERVGLPEHYSSEPDNCGLYVPKGGTSMEPHARIPWVEDGAVRSHGIVATTQSADRTLRQASYRQLKRMRDEGQNDCARIMLEALTSLEDELSDGPGVKTKTKTKTLPLLRSA